MNLSLGLGWTATLWRNVSGCIIAIGILPWEISSSKITSWHEHLRSSGNSWAAMRHKLGLSIGRWRSRKTRTLFLLINTMRWRYIQRTIGLRRLSWDRIIPSKLWKHPSKIAPFGYPPHGGSSWRCTSRRAHSKTSGRRKAMTKFKHGMSSGHWSNNKFRWYLPSSVTSRWSLEGLRTIRLHRGGIGPLSYWREQGINTLCGCGMQSTWVWSLSHYLTTSLRHNHTLFTYDIDFRCNLCWFGASAMT